MTIRLSAFAWVVVLASCSGERDMSDLDAYLESVRNREPAPMEAPSKLPEAPPLPPRRIDGDPFAKAPP